jgi:predicted nucleotide-binding protein (sugar kinase/HSP70/actin superfamily)
MPYRKKGVKVTVELLDDILNDVVEKFYSSDAPLYLKKKLTHVQPIFCVTRRRKCNLIGSAWAVGCSYKKDAVKNQLKLNKNTHPTIILDGDYYFLIIKINKGAFRGITRRGLRYLVAHELAHILQIVVDEEVDDNYSYSTANDHDAKWLKYTKWMGGTGSELIPPEEIWV